MASQNEITNDLLVSKGASKEYTENYDKIFGEKTSCVVSEDGVEYKKCGQRCWLEIKDGKPTCNKPNCLGKFDGRS